MIPEPLLRRCYTDDADEFVAAVTAALPADVDADAEAREWHARQTAVTAAVNAPNAPGGKYVPHRLGKGVQGGGRFAKVGDVGIPLLRDLLRGDGKARTEVHKLFGKKLRNGGDGTGWGRGDLNGPNITRWATESFGPRPNGPDGNAWDAGRRELGAYLAAQPLRSRIPAAPKAPNAPGDGPDWDGAKIGTEARHNGPNGPEWWKKVDDKAWELQDAEDGQERVLEQPPDGAQIESGATLRDDLRTATADAARPRYNPDKAAQPGEFAQRNADKPGRDRPVYDPSQPPVAGEFAQRNAKPTVAERVAAQEQARTDKVAADAAGNLKPVAPPEPIRKPVPDSELIDWNRPDAGVKKGVDFEGVQGTVPTRVADAITAGDGTRDNPFVTDNVEAAAFMLGKDKHVQLQSPDQVATLLDQLQQRVKLLKDTGADTPNFDLCKVTVPGTNLFCVESPRTDEFPDGIPRVKMPQLGGVPLPGSKAAAMELNDRGEVDLSQAFIEHLKAQGIAVTERDVDASHLKASQIELNGTKIVGMMGALRDGKLPPGAIFVSRDNYVVDGHHRWAANVGAEYVDGQPMMMPTFTIDAPILDVLAMANAFALEMGIPQAGVGDMRTGGGDGSNDRADLFDGLDLTPEVKSAITGGTGSKADPFTTADPAAAAALLYHDQHVKLETHPGQLTVVLDEVKVMAGQYKADGPQIDGIRRVDDADGKPTWMLGSDRVGSTPIGTLFSNANGRFRVDGAGKVTDTKTGRQMALADAVNGTPDVKVEPPTYDLCKLTVPGTNLFCVESKGIPRVKMPQLSGTPLPGSPADDMPKDNEGRVNLTERFPAWLAERGISVTPGRRKVKEMKATQNELDGGKVSGIMQGWRDVQARGITRDPDAPEGVNRFVTADGEVIEGVQADRLAGLTDRIFVDRDGYVVDGHHRWAGAMAADVEDDGDLDLEMDTMEIDESVDIVEVIALANAFAYEMGIPQAGVGQETGDAKKGAPDAPNAPGTPDAPAAPQANDRPEPPATPPAPETRPFVASDDFLSRYGIPKGTEVQARYHDDDKAIIDVTKPDGTVQQVKVPWARLGLPAAPAANDRAGSGITFTAMPATSVTISDADRSLGETYNPRSQRLYELSTQNLLTRLQIADAMERNPPDAGTAQFLRDVQAASQDELRAKGITHVTLYRGIAAETDTPFPHDTTGLSSWTTNPDIAADYAKGSGGTLFKAEVPIEQILSWDALGALRNPHADQPGAEVLVARDMSTADRIRTGTFPFVASAPSAMAGTKADYDPWSVFNTPAAPAAPDVAPGGNDRPDAPDAPDAPAAPEPSYLAAQAQAIREADQAIRAYHDRPHPPPEPVSADRFEGLGRIKNGLLDSPAGERNKAWLTEQFQRRAAEDPTWGRDDIDNYMDMRNAPRRQAAEALSELFDMSSVPMTRDRVAAEDLLASWLKANPAGSVLPPKRKGLSGVMDRLRGNPVSKKPIADRTPAELLAGDASPTHIRSLLKRSDLTDQQREQLRGMLSPYHSQQSWLDGPDTYTGPPPVVAALALADRVLEDAHNRRVAEALALAAMYNGGAGKEQR